MSNSNVLYYEPNYTQSFSNGRGNKVMMPPPLENYCIIADLEVVVPSRPILGQIKNDDVTYVIRYASSKDGNSKVSFFQGKTFADLEPTFLSTDPTEFGTFSDVNKTTGTTTEMFGINSIDIEYNTYSVPVVTIKFTDIRGISLFASEDLRNNKTIDGIKNCSNQDIAGSFFKCFFTFPFPKFKLRVKGYYGRPVCYELTCSDFRAAFESSTGNFSATAKFVGYSFSVLNDLTLPSLLASPDSEYYGAEYWKNSNFCFDDGTPIPKMSEFIERVAAATQTQSDVTKEEANSLKPEEDEEKDLQLIISAHDSYVEKLIHELNACGVKYVSNNQARQVVGHFAQEDMGEMSDDVFSESKRIYDNFIKLLNNIEEPPIAPQRYGQTTTNPFKDENKDFSSIDITGVENTITENKYAYSYDGKEFHKRLVDRLNDVKKRIETLKDDFSKIRTNEITQIIKFRPSVKNMTDMVLAHIDTFISEVYYCVSQVPSSSPTYRSENGKNSGYAFPEVTKRVIDGLTRKDEVSWIGEYDLDAPETHLVNSLIGATNKIHETFSVVNKKLNAPKDKVQYSVPHPIIVADVIGKSSPFAHVELDSIVSVASALGTRALIIANAYPSKKENVKTYDDFLTQCGVCDARNFLDTHPNLTSKFITRLQEGGTWTADKITKLILSNTKSDIVDIDTILPWVNGNKEYITGGYFTTFFDTSYSPFYDENGRCLIPLGEFSWEEYHALEKNTIHNISDYFSIGYGENTSRCQLIEDIKNYQPSQNGILPKEFKSGDYGLEDYAAKKFKNYVKSGENDYLSHLPFIKFSSRSGYYSTIDTILQNCGHITDIERVRSLMFLHFMGSVYKTPKQFSRVMYVPKLYLVTLGAYLANKDFIDNVLLQKYKRDFECLDEDVFNFAEELKIELVKYYEKWYQEKWLGLYNEYLELDFNDGYDISTLEKELANCHSDENKYTSVIQTQIKNHEYFHSINSYNGNKSVMVAYNENEATVSLWKELNQPILVMYDGNRLQDSTPLIISSNIEKYISSFVTHLQELLPQNTIETARKEIAINKVNKDVGCALYKYIKLVWDKWLSGNPLHNGQHKWNYHSFRKRWHFIDAFYNQLNDEATMDVFLFTKDVTNAYEVQGHSALSLLSTSYARNLFMLICVQNFLSMSDAQKMEQIFTPIPFKGVEYDGNDEIPDFVIMYTNEPSSKIGTESNNDCGDSFFLSGGDGKPLPIAIETKDLAKGYKIPAFGVTYGEQYQSYFKDIQISMENPQVTDVALQSQYKIAKAASGGENGKDAYIIGQNLFTIYSNMSFTCNVTMMGCAWIQPLMLFQLNNIPMFSGTYLIQKVSHSINPGDMTTTFIGTRMSSKSSPFTENHVIESKNNQSGGYNNYEISDYIAKQATIDNDCAYKYFSPLNDSGDVGMLEEELSWTLTEYANKYGEWKIDLKDKETTTVLEFLSWVVFNESSVLDDYGKKHTCSVIFNRYYSAGKSLIKTFFNKYQHASEKTSEWDECTEKEKYYQIVREIFVQTPITLVGHETFVKKPVPIWNHNKPLLDANGKYITTTSKNVTEHDVKSMDGYCTTNGYDVTYLKRDGKTIEPLPPNTWTAGEYLFQHDGKDRLGHVLVSMGTKYSKPKEYWHLSPKRKNGNENPSPMAKALFEALKKTIDFSSNVMVNNLTLNKTNSGNANAVIFKASSGEENAQVFDILLNTYSDYFTTLYWVTRNGGYDLPSEIYVVVTDVPSNIKSVAAVDVNMHVLNQTDGYNDLFIKSLKKRYRDLNTHALAFTQDCKNFTSITCKRDWKNHIQQIFDTVILTKCITNDGIEESDEDFNTIGGYHYNGVNASKNKMKPSVIDSTNYDVIGAAKYAFDKAKTEPQSNCAMFVRIAMSEGGKLDITTGTTPFSACVYAKHLPYWGFKKVYDADSKTNATYTPQNGDICVVAADNKTHKHGHIHIYYEGKWCSDFKANNIVPYGDMKIRPYQIFRHPNAQKA